MKCTSRSLENGSTACNVRRKRFSTTSIARKIGYTKGRKCTNCLCRVCKSCSRREPPWGATTAGDYYCKACPHQKCATCKSMKPLATFPPVEGERRVRHDKYVCTQCQKMCVECNKEKVNNASSRVTRCHTCQFPTCAKCTYKRKESEGAVRLEQKVAATGQANAVKIWYCAKCNDPACQAGLPSQQRCEFCGETKDTRTCYRDMHRGYSTVCGECEHPKCAACGSTHEGQRGLRNDHQSIIGENFNKQWFCNAKVCKEKMKAIIQ